MPRKVIGCHRPIISCGRCRVKKIKCDKADPCSQCVAAKVQCPGSSDGKNDNVPRSITQFLREDIRRLEKRLIEWPQHTLEVLVDDSATVASRNVNHAALTKDAAMAESEESRQDQFDKEGAQLRTRIRNCPSIRKFIRSFTLSQASVNDITRSAMSLTSSRVLTSSGTRNEGEKDTGSRDERQNRDLINVKFLATMPTRIVGTLVKVFIEKIHSLHPIIHEPTLWTQFRRVMRILHEEKVTNVAPDYDFLTLHIVLAISASLGSASSGHGAQRMAFSESLFQEGIQHMSNPSIFPSEMEELQVSLLTLHYGTINPRCANVWMLSGSAMRLCLKLGLHREIEDPTTGNTLFVDMRRRLFWMSYCLDRHVCAALQYPVSLSDATICTSEFAAVDDKMLGADTLSIKNDHNTKHPALHWLEYRQIHSEMVEVHFRGKSFGDCNSLDTWISRTEARLSMWYQRHQEDYPWTETAYHNALTYLHRPSPLTPKPAARSLLIAFENACAVASSYAKDIQAGYFRRPWLAAHHTFASACIVLFCLRHGSTVILTEFQPHQVAEMTAIFSLNLQSVSSQFWPEVSRCLEIYNQLLDPLITAVMSNNDPGLKFTPEQDDQLAHLLYPGTTRFEALLSGDMELDTQFDFVNTSIPSTLDVFDWDFSRFDDIEWNEGSFDAWNGHFEDSAWLEPYILT